MQTEKGYFQSSRSCSTPTFWNVGFWHWGNLQSKNFSVGGGAVLLA